MYKKRRTQEIDKQITKKKTNYNENVMYARGMDDLSIFAVVFFPLLVYIFCVILPCFFLLLLSLEVHTNVRTHKNQKELTSTQRLEHTSQTTTTAWTAKVKERARERNTET